MPNGSNTAEKAAKRVMPRGVPFVKGVDPRRNLNGRPKSFDQVRNLALEIANEGDTAKVEQILRKWANSKDRQQEKDFIELAYGKVPDKLEATGLGQKPVLILHYAHERQDADQN